MGSHNAYKEHLDWSNVARSCISIDMWMIVCIHYCVGQLSCSKVPKSTHCHGNDLHFYYLLGISSVDKYA